MHRYALMQVGKSESASATMLAVAIVACVALLAMPALHLMGTSSERAIASTTTTNAVALGSVLSAAHHDRNLAPPRRFEASRFTGLWEVSAVAIQEELAGLAQFALYVGKTVGLVVVGKGGDGAVGQLLTDVAVGILTLPKMLFDRAMTIVAPSSTLEQRVDAATRFAVDIGLTMVGVRGVKLARIQGSKFLYRGWSNDRIISTIAKPRPKGLRRDFWNEMRVQRLQFVLADRIKARIHVQDVRVTRKTPWLTRKQYFEADDVANQLARTAVRKGDDFFDNEHILRLSQGWDMHMAPVSSMLRPTGSVALRKPPPRFFLPAVPQFRVVGEVLKVAPMANWALGKLSKTSLAQSISRTVFGNRLLRRVRELHRGGVQELDYRIVRQRSASGPDASLGVQSQALARPGRVEVDTALRGRLGHSEAVDAVLFESTRLPKLAHALERGAPVRIRPFDAKYPNGRIRIREGRVEVSPGRRAFELEDDLDLERAVVSPN